MTQVIDDGALDEVVAMMAAGAQEVETDDPTFECGAKIYQVAGLLNILSKAIHRDRAQTNDIKEDIFHGYSELLDIAQVLLQDAARKLNRIGADVSGADCDDE